jgi:hypothetical protein
MAFLKMFIWKNRISGCKTQSQMNEILDFMIERKEEFTDMERFELGLYAVRQIKKIAGVK